MRTLEESQSNFMADILRVNISCNTNWNTRCEKLQRKYNIKKGEDQDLEEAVREKDRQSKLRRLEGVVHRTTERYRRLNKFENNRPLSYLRLNTNRRVAVGTLHGLRAGANDTEECLYTRRRIRSPRCTRCEEETGDVIHRIERCCAYELKRRYLEKKIGEDIRGLKLSDIVLNSDEFKTAMEKKDLRTREKIDNRIKDFVLAIR